MYNNNKSFSTYYNKIYKLYFYYIHLFCIDLWGY